MTPRIVLTAEELDALHGTGPLAIAVYLTLRTAMDFATGTVGRSRPISLHGLAMATETHIPRGKGVQVAQPSEKETRLALERLSRAGLLCRLAGDRLAFSLPLALLASARPAQTGRSAGTDLFTEPGTANPAPALAFRPIAGYTGQSFRTPETGKPGTYRCTEKSYMPPPGAVENSQPIAGSTLSGGRTTEGWISNLPPASTAPAVCDLSGIEASPAELAQAMATAQRIRAREGSSQPIGPGLLRRLLAKPTQAERPGKLSSDELVKLGTERGMPPRPGESWEQYRRRLDARPMATA